MRGRRTRTSALLLAFSMSAGCYPDLGECDPAAAGEIVYDPSGVPAYAGQAIMIESCGGGGYCHSEGIDPEQRHGAPVGLDFDLRVASTTVEVEEDAALRLQRDRIAVQDNAGLIWQQVLSGRMPPGGAAWAAYQEPPPGQPAPAPFQRVDDDGSTFHDLPRLRALPGEAPDAEESAAAREILRNWLACGAPVIERTQTRIDRDDNLTGDTASVCERDCAYPSWESIYRLVIAPSCARSRCHDDTEPAEDLDLFADLDTSDLDVARTRMANVVDRISGAEAEGSLCRPERIPILTPNDPSASLLYLKVSANSEDAVCGSRMPLSGNPLTPQRSCAISEWIRCGACSPTDAECIAAAEACLDSPPEGVDPRCGTASTPDPATGVAQCAERSDCPNHLSAM